ncbi:MAG: hypothetical protein CSA84_03200 [Actinomycetales bacterium]|nr:MAG: hypothetical protein CSA84_03200 [Actinomycetales bacterium]
MVLTSDPGGSRQLPVCDTCGAVAVAGEQAEATLTWSRGIEQGRVVWTCARCSREHVRSIEGRLDSQWW